MAKMAADFESQTQQLANNTNMGAAGLPKMRAGVLELSRETGLPLQQLSEGWMQIANHAYEGAAAMNIARAAARNAAATGGDAADDMNVLAGVMREYGVSATQAANDTGLATRYLDVLHNAVSNSAFTMREFAEGAKMAFATGGRLWRAALAGEQRSWRSSPSMAFPACSGRPSTGWACCAAGEPHGQGAEEHAGALEGDGRRPGGRHRPAAPGRLFPAAVFGGHPEGDGGRSGDRGIMTQQSYANALQALVRFGGELQKIQS
jgi:hypothetical protein